MISQLDRRRIVLFVILSFGLAWLIALPLWLSGGGLNDPRAGYLIPLMMFAPAAATLLLLFVISPESDKRRATGIGLGAKGWHWYWAFSWLVTPALVLGALFVGELFGVYEMDLRELSGLRQLLEESTGGAAVLEQMSLKTLALLQLLQAVLLAPIINAVFILGEELGWRGYLLPKLLPLGQWPALLLSGVIWGLWHAPVILLGYNYPEHPRLGLLLMVVVCVIMGILFGWTRLATGSVWPAVIGHGALNGSASLVTIFAAAGSEYDAAQAANTGWTGWILPLLLILVLVALRRLPVPHPPDLEPR